jgi:hypothetical protein
MRLGFRGRDIGFKIAGVNVHNSKERPQCQSLG